LTNCSRGYIIFENLILKMEEMVEAKQDEVY